MAARLFLATQCSAVREKVWTGDGIAGVDSDAIVIHSSCHELLGGDVMKRAIVKRIERVVHFVCGRTEIDEKFVWIDAKLRQIFYRFRATLLLEVMPTEMRKHECVRRWMIQYRTDTVGEREEKRDARLARHERVGDGMLRLGKSCASLAPGDFVILAEVICIIR